MFLHFAFSRSLHALPYYWCGIRTARGESERCILGLLWYLAAQTVAATHLSISWWQYCPPHYAWARAISCCDTRLRTLHQTCGLPTDQTSVHSGMRLSETARGVKHRWWAVFINRISQGRVETPIRRGGQFCCNFVANLLQYLCAKILKYNAVWQSYCIRRVQFFCLTKGNVFIKNKAKFASKWVVVREESCILESCCSSPIRRNSVLEELRVRRFASHPRRDLW